MGGKYAGRREEGNERAGRREEEKSVTYHSHSNEVIPTLPFDRREVCPRDPSLFIFRVLLRSCFSHLSGSLFIVT